VDRIVRQPVSPVIRYYARLTTAYSSDESATPRKLGINLLGGRNSALQNLVAEVPLMLCTAEICFLNSG
jgi:hypothetical protein